MTHPSTQHALYNALEASRRALGDQAQADIEAMRQNANLVGEQMRQNSANTCVKAAVQRWKTVA